MYKESDDDNRLLLNVAADLNSRTESYSKLYELYDADGFTLKGICKQRSSEILREATVGIVNSVQDRETLHLGFQGISRCKIAKWGGEVFQLILYTYIDKRKTSHPYEIPVCRTIYPVYARYTGISCDKPVTRTIYGYFVETE
jgi:hypothetical protein